MREVDRASKSNVIMSAAFHSRLDIQLRYAGKSYIDGSAQQ
jgi:hypothetical protein